MKLHSNILKSSRGLVYFVSYSVEKLCNLTNVVITLRDTPEIRLINVTPPLPKAIASDARYKRLCFSFSFTYFVNISTNLFLHSYYDFNNDNIWNVIDWALLKRKLLSTNLEVNN